MISNQALGWLHELGLTLDWISMFPNQVEVSVGVRDSSGNRWIGRATKDPRNPETSLATAFTNALDQFDKTWRQTVGAVDSGPVL
jgi:hypothetical protein